MEEVEKYSRNFLYSKQGSSIPGFKSYPKVAGGRNVAPTKQQPIS
jgi:hypothetical protein